MAKDKVEVKYKGGLLNKLLRNVKNMGYIKLGIIGTSNNQRAKKDGQKEAPTNAYIGAVHEFGYEDKNIPQRSFLRMPIEDDFDNKLLNNTNPKELTRQLVKDPDGFLEEVAEVAKAVVLEAFDRGGSSKTKWPPLAPDTLKRKKNLQILVETTQLRDSIDYEIIKGGK